MNSHKPLGMKEYVKYLGVYIDADLFWNTISSTYSVLKVGVTAKLRHFVSSQTSLSIFHSLISPYLTYGIYVLGAQVLKFIQTNY